MIKYIMRNFQDKGTSLFTATLLKNLLVMVDILLTCKIHLPDVIISLWGYALTHRTSLTLPLYTEVPAPIQ
jgi:hypothetical protein